MKGKIWILFFLGVCLAGCSAQATETDTKKTGETIVVGTGNAYPPFVYLDEKNEVTGYDIAVLKEIDKRLPDYQFQYESMDFKTILTALSSNHVQLAAHQYAENEERKAKYLYAHTGYTDFTMYITQNKTTQVPITSLQDLAGKKVFASSGSNAAYLLETFNQTHATPIQIVYNDGSNEVIVKGLQNKTADAALMTKFDIAKLNKQFQANLVATGEPVKKAKTYFLFQKKNTTLQKAVDRALETMIEDGTLSKLSIQYLGEDFTK
ncbi:MULTISPECIES: transporter substrate-binding domain-containing protein [Enterococcus]|uniref:Solute-binding protein family 3/N-terminal domain-containing protein n=1 Tax=Enterococcus sulfureus ATCC 49903 TaxID=1140003 RepID=S0KXL9_9ENTE|nr:transporter substrate-binding domain-containing protein [Enterococcus sulfureus]EOT45810.1 hypothetical protein OMY_02043 [Enterococcus sulfureus ATCC 49903]EOT82925.1 hypothetical protein I573_02038 [Enterococcus sulfureus ATCC 49903]